MTMCCNWPPSRPRPGRDVLDINVGVPGINEAEVMRGVVLAVSAHMDIPLCLDSNDPNTLAAGLAVAPGRPLINSVNGEEKSLAAILPVAKEFGVPVIGLVIDDDGISMDPEKRLSIAGKIIERAAALGIPLRISSLIHWRWPSAPTMAPGLSRCARLILSIVNLGST